MVVRSERIISNQVELHALGDRDNHLSMSERLLIGHGINRRYHLGVNYMLEGSVQRSGDRIRVTGSSVMF